MFDLMAHIGTPTMWDLGRLNTRRICFNNTYLNEEGKWERKDRVFGSFATLRLAPNVWHMLQFRTRPLKVPQMNTN